MFFRLNRRRRPLPWLLLLVLAGAGGGAVVGALPPATAAFAFTAPHRSQAQ